MAECKIAVPFGTTSKRFETIGYHPKLENRAGTWQFEQLAPGCYDCDKPPKIVGMIPRWKRQLKVEAFAKRMGYVGDHKLKKRKWLNSINGPGWQDVPLSLHEGKITFSKADRFKYETRKAYAVPGPGTYGKNHVPCVSVEEKSHAKGFSFSNLPTFEQTNKMPRSFTVQKSYSLPPNLYKLKNSTDEILSKSISKRGPYDLFTGERFPDPVGYKHSPLPLRPNPNDLNNPKNAFKGVFLRCGKESLITSRQALTTLSACKKNPLDPGPSDYNPYPTPIVPQTKAPFNCSVAEIRPVPKCELKAPPGRYNTDLKKNIKGDGMRSAFLSKVKRTFPVPEKCSWFE